MRLPSQQSDPNQYCRLLPRSEAVVDQHGLVKLGKAMIDEGGDVSNPGSPDEYLADAGYTYFGQFIDHDLTEMDPLGRVIVHVTKDFHNLQSPHLDLGHLYGDGSRPSPLYDGDGATFKIGPVSGRGSSFDVHVDPATDEPVVADGRSHENLMLRQIVAVFLRLHNVAFTQFGDFNAACQHMRWQFQYLVVEDYLRRMLDPSVWTKVFVDKNFHFAWDQQFSVPAEFAGAAMRFGHSMVRPSYVFRDENEQSLQDILHRSNQPSQLDDSWEIPWSLFFQGAKGGTFTMTSRPIDTLIAKPLHELRPHTIELFTVDKAPLPPPAEPFRLPVRTLLRGLQLKFPPGQLAADEFGVPRLTSEELQRPRGKFPGHGSILQEFGLLSDTPLWYYILKESEVRWNGSYLGAVGSHIVAETIAGALRYDPNSYWNVQPPSGSWPPVWQIDGQTTRIFTLAELFRLASPA